MDAQPDFTAAASGLRLAAQHLELCHNIPALDAGTLLLRIDQILEQQRLMSEQLGLLNRKFDDLHHTVTVSHRNFTACLENSNVVSSEMLLAPLYNVHTGQVLAGCPETLAELEALTASQAADFLRMMGQQVPRGHEERKRRLKMAFGLRTRVV
ncbi:hypothetical protein A9K55_002150 [Cordyceps militaris]|uniref:Uncharacterized protein n=1 Tax=Cordyceps militaris TaxID=73501 RepID=A0A2H4SSA2_CORMI|nr:hypothetical protein A9K55_002150 [Cordyceps militaris]